MFVSFTEICTNFILILPRTLKRQNVISKTKYVYDDVKGFEVYEFTTIKKFFRILHQLLFKKKNSLIKYQ